GTPPHSCEGPSESLEHRLSLHVIAELFEREIPIPIALDGQTLAVTFHDQTDAPRSDLPPRNDVVAGPDQVLHDIAFQCGLEVFFFIVEGPSEEVGCVRVLNEPPAEGGGVKVRWRGVAERRGGGAARARAVR